ncbi:MAG: hypothetical protein NVS3B19_11490 [Ginsengibacter sp.]
MKTVGALSNLEMQLHISGASTKVSEDATITDCETKHAIMNVMNAFIGAMKNQSK